MIIGYDEKIFKYQVREWDELIKCNHILSEFGDW